MKQVYVITPFGVREDTSDGNMVISKYRDDVKVVGFPEKKSSGVNWLAFVIICILLAIDPTAGLAALSGHIVAFK